MKGLNGSKKLSVEKCTRTSTTTLYHPQYLHHEVTVSISSSSSSFKVCKSTIISRLCSTRLHILHSILFIVDTSRSCRSDPRIRCCPSLSERIQIHFRIRNRKAAQTTIHTRKIRPNQPDRSQCARKRSSDQTPIPRNWR